MSRVALVTGGSRGIGRATSVLLGSRGFRVAVNYASRDDAAAEVVDQIRSGGGEAVPVRGDVSRPDDVDEMFAKVDAELGAIEVLVNNAGITRDGLLVRMSQEDWDEVMRVNLGAMFLSTRAALRSMIRHRWGRIINITSMAGLAGNAGQANYAASKAGVVGFTKSIAKEVGTRGITVNAVAPGFIDTDLTSGLSDDMRRRTTDMISVGRWGTPEEVASVIGYLASDEASYVTGQVVVVDGGLTM